MKQVDVLVIGGGVVGSAILHKLSSLNIKAALIEKEPDLCEGTSKANSALLHTGFDEPVDSIEAECLIRSQALWLNIIENHNLSYEERGAVMVAFTEEERKVIEDKYMENARLNGVMVRWLTREEILAKNPGVNKDCIGGLFIEKEGIIDPFEATYTFAEVAVLNGAEVMLNSEAVQISPDNEGFVVTLGNDSKIQASYIVNAAGLHGDVIARLIDDDSFTLKPRKGQFIVTKSHIDIENIILPVPTPISKGKLVTPAVFGGHLLGPTAEDMEDKEDKSTTEDGLEEILEGCEKMVPAARTFTTVRQYAGLRSVYAGGDYILRPSDYDKRMIHVAGIRSTGLSAAPGIAEKTAEMLEEIGASFDEKNDWEPNLSKLTSGKESTDEMVCLCKSVTKNDIVQALNRSIAPASLDGVKRRTEAMLGECQGSCCIPKIIDLMGENQNIEGLPVKGGRNTDMAFKD
ncbi:NAD(P)/FAD-dependent oxidoreductase [Salinicoccus albus]|uniref:NAD(P)/FAD-dependent oxidoreductase n=1 Tax=Salinicoccus albus TaxID=418756 RepID=UPI000362D776|nr:NAD(P)/FAD-dependent oxidoreductase [Salinicoccus albus]